MSNSKFINNLLLFSGLHSYIDGTKDWKTMKKRLRFQLPHTPLKVLRGEQDQEDIQDQYYERFQAPGTTTEDADDDRDTDNDSITSSLPHEDMATDIDAASDTGEVSEEGLARYLGGSLDTENDPTNAAEYINLETTDIQVVAQVHQLPDSDITSNDSVSNDDTTPLLDDRQ